MFETLSTLPFSFWAAIAMFLYGGVRAARCLRDGSGLPMLAVLGTVAVWYVGDVFYNDYAGEYTGEFNSGVLRSAWWQVAWFLLVFVLATPCIHRRVNARHLRRGSGILQMFKHGVGQPGFQTQLNYLLLGCGLMWVLLATVAAVRLEEELPFFFFPFLGHKAEPWGRGRIGAGFDALLSACYYLQLLAAATFGVVAALSTSRLSRLLALVFCVLSWPYFVFDRTRNTMLAVVVPAITSWVFLRQRGGILQKVVTLLICFTLVNAWMKFVIANRSDMSVSEALKHRGFSLSDKEHVHHAGLNMYEELCWISSFMDQGIYRPSWGGRYLAEMVNFIPRSLWPGKPLIGIDYAIVRGQGGSRDSNQAGVNSTVSTGLIGQGVVNFGRILGPAAAALLMSFWVAVMARLDLNCGKVGRVLLYAFGLILTFNLGRDITLITLYPFVFGAMLLWLADRFRSGAHTEATPTTRPQQRRTGPGTHAALARFPIPRWRFVARRQSQIR
jgi:hypothetical protein